MSISDVSRQSPPGTVDVQTRADFLSNGFARLERFVDDDDFAVIGEAYDRMFDPDNPDAPAKKQLGGRDEDGRAALPQVLAPLEVEPCLTELPYFERARRAAKVLLGDDAELRGSHAILKPAGYGIATPWHQDQAYHDPAIAYTNVNFWIPLDDVDVAGGCMQYVAGSHLGRVVVPHQYLDPDDDSTAMVAQDQGYWSANAQALPCRRGDCALHHSYCLHYAGPNHSGVDRRALILVFGRPKVERERAWVFPWRA
ncbi:MAG: phytanoyl-CoA dioxygenase family protein [Planctomycetota bacterium]